MSTIYNKVQLIGHLGAAPEFKTLENGNSYAKLSIATKDIYKNAKGEKVIDTQWHRATAWGKTAEYANKYLEKGSLILIDGRLTHNDFIDKDGQKRYFTDVHVNEIMNLERKEVAQVK